jgi:hypothetical protein
MKERTPVNVSSMSEHYPIHLAGIALKVAK